MRLRCIRQPATTVVVLNCALIRSSSQPSNRKSARPCPCCQHADLHIWLQSAARVKASKTTHYPALAFMLVTSICTADPCQVQTSLTGVPTWSAVLANNPALCHAVLRSDALRPFVLHTYGGVYLDLDTECFASMDGSLQGLCYLAGHRHHLGL